jgi:hypothetical protein
MRKYTGFLSAKTLNLSPAERKGFIKVLKDFEAGRVLNEDDEPPALGTGNRFDMSHVRVVNECGATCCIAGWVAYAMASRGKSPTRATLLYRSLTNRTHTLDALCHASPDLYDGHDWMKIARVKHGARALRNFLTTGKPNWRKAMGKDA